MALRVEKGEGFSSVGKELQQKGIIDSPGFFKLYGWITGKGEKVKAGEYSLHSGMSIKEIVDKLAEGEMLKKVKTIKIIEGWDLEDIAFHIEEKGLADKKEFLKVTGKPKKKYTDPENDPRPYDFSREYSFLKNKPRHYGLEGYLFPDTYEVFRDASVRDIVEKMLDNFDRKLTEEMRKDIEAMAKASELDRNLNWD